MLASSALAGKRMTRSMVRLTKRGLCSMAAGLQMSGADGQAAGVQGTQLNPECAAAGLQGFPSWVINGKQYSGEQSFEQLEAALDKLTQ